MSEDRRYVNDELDRIEDAFHEVLEKVRAGQVRLEVDRSERMTARVYGFLYEATGVRAMHLPEESTIGEFILDDVGMEQAAAALAYYDIALDETALDMPLWHLCALATVDTTVAH